MFNVRIIYVRCSGNICILCLPVIFNVFRLYSMSSGYIQCLPVIFNVFRLYSMSSGYIQCLPVIFNVFRLYSMSSGYIQCLPENGIMGNLKAPKTTALIGWLLFNC